MRSSTCGQRAPATAQHRTCCPLQRPWHATIPPHHQTPAFAGSVGTTPEPFPTARVTAHHKLVCSAAVDEVQTQSPRLLSNPALSSPAITHQELNCVASGLDSVECFIEDVSGPESPTDDRSSQEGTGTSNWQLGSLATQILKSATLVSPFFFWGTSMVVMKGVMPHTTPLAMGSLRLLPAGLILVAWAAANKRSQPQTPKAWLWILAFALIDAAAFQAFLAEGLQRTSAGLGSVIIDSQPLTVAVLAATLFGESLSAPAVVGLLVGVLGLSLLEVPGESLQEAAGSLLSAGWQASFGEWDWSHLQDSGNFWMLLAAQSMAVGTVMVRYVTKHVDPVMATGWHMAIGGVLLAALAAVTDGDVLQDRFSQFDGHDLASMLYVSLLGGAAGYGIFFYNASKGNLTALSSLTFLTPVFASVAGYLALEEVLSPMQMVGGVVTLSAVGLINYKPTGEGKAAAQRGSGSGANGKEQVAVAVPVKSGGSSKRR